MGCLDPAFFPSHMVMIPIALPVGTSTIDFSMSGDHPARGDEPCRGFLRACKSFRNLFRRTGIPMAHRVLIADENDAVRAGLRMLLDRLGGFEVVGEAVEGRVAVGMSQTLCPDLVLLDIDLPGQGGSECTRQILKFHAHTRVIVVSTRVDQRRTTGVLDAGAVSFVLKDRALQGLAGSALRAVIEGKTFLSPEIANVLGDDHSQIGMDHETGAAASALSPAAPGS